MSFRLVQTGKAATIDSKENSPLPGANCAPMRAVLGRQSLHCPSSEEVDAMSSGRFQSFQHFLAIFLFSGINRDDVVSILELLLVVAQALKIGIREVFQKPVDSR